MNKQFAAFVDGNKTRLVLVLLVGLICAGMLSAYQTIQPAFLASIASNQLEDSVVTYSLVHKLMYSSIVEDTIAWVGIILIFLLLFSPIKRAITSSIKQEEVK